MRRQMNKHYLLIFVIVFVIFFGIIFSISKQVKIEQNERDHEENIEKNNIENENENTVILTDSEEAGEKQSVGFDEDINEIYHKFLAGEDGAVFMSNGDTLWMSGTVSKDGTNNNTQAGLKYSFYDSDQDGLDELHVKTADSYYILKKQNEKIVVWADLPVDYEPLNTGNLFSWVKKDTVSDKEEYRYCLLFPNGEIAWETSFSRIKNEYYFENVQVTKEQWKGMTDYFLTMGSFEIVWNENNESLIFEIHEKEEEAFVALEKSEQEKIRKEAISLYEEFIRGDYSITYSPNQNSEKLNIDLKYYTDVTGEPNKHYFTQYAYFDGDKDGLEELHILSERYYDIIKYQDGELVIDELSEEIDRDYTLLNNGAYLYQKDLDVWGARNFSIYGDKGKTILEISFNMRCPEGYIFPSEESQIIYYYLGAEVTKEQYEELIQPILDIGTEKIGWVNISQGTY